MPRAISMAILAAAVSAILGGCAWRGRQPARLPAAAKPAVSAATLPPGAARKPSGAAWEEPAPTAVLALPLPEEAPPSDVQAVYLQIVPDSSELEVELIGP